MTNHKFKGFLSHLFHSIFPDRTSIIIFLLAFTLLLTFWQVGLLLNDEWISANQLTNLKNGSLYAETIKYGTDRGIYNVSGRPVASYTHALPVFALPIYCALSAVDHLVNLRLFFIFIWLTAVLALLYYYSGTKRTKYTLAIFAMLFFAANVLLYVYPSLYGFWSFLYHPLNFNRWGEILAITFLNILAMCFVILIIYRLFKLIFDNEKIGFLGALMGLIGTSFSLWALTGKDHSVSLLFIMLGIFFYYTYASSNRSRYKYLAFAMVGLLVWVRPEAAVPLFVALFLSEILYVHRDNPVRTQLMNILKIFAVIVIALMPFFINNYLLSENILLPPLTATIPNMNASAEAIIAERINETVPVATKITKSTSGIIAIFDWMFRDYREIPRNLVPFLFHNDNPALMSIFEVCPVLIFSLLMLYRFYLLLRANASAIIKKENYLPFLFFCYILVQLLIYSAQTNTDFYIVGQWDYRFFLPIYIPLLYLSFSVLKDYGVLDKLQEISTALVSCIVILTPSLIFGNGVFGKIIGTKDFYNVCILCEILALIAITTLFSSFLYLALRRSERSKEMFAYAIGISIFSTFFWLFGIGFMWGKAPCAGFVLPAMNYLHGLIAYHAGLKFFMDMVSPFVPLSTLI